MKISKAIRNAFGVTQMQMAVYLQVTRSQLTMYENGKRDLPLAALVKLSEMEVFLNVLEATPNSTSMPFEDVQLEKAAVVLEKYLNEAAFQLLALQKQLDTMQKAYRQNGQLLQCIAALEIKNTAVPGVPDSGLQQMKRTATDKIDKNGLHHQARLYLKLKMQILHDKQNFINNLTKNSLNI
ncbi:helix-turn-helix domain-containing protein [Flavobacterium tegetincola]|uniref:helix-turn-helix domain-containing protein n=1 Tax=Flavobacterium tegetincola TaxID=150172 RepID=UPI000403162A|nr:helix-turn-helix transcriptional regulator [Flavobacterium tegetincola]